MTADKLDIIETLAALRLEVERLGKKTDEIHGFAMRAAAAAAAAQAAVEARVPDAEQYRSDFERTLSDAKVELLDTARTIDNDLTATTKTIDRALQQAADHLTSRLSAALTNEIATGRHPGPGAPAPTIRARILVAEDLEIIQELARSLLESAGHQVDIVSDGAQAIAAVQTRHYDLILMDVQMPGLDGITATKAIRALDHPTRNIPILAMTADVLPQQVRTFKEAGMNDHIDKPVKRNNLLEKLSEWLPTSHIVLEVAPERPSAGAAFNRKAFDDFRSIMSSESVGPWLARLKEQLESVFDSDLVAVDREHLARRAYGVVSQAAIPGFSELSRLCCELGEACTSGKDLSLPFERARRASRIVREMIEQLTRSPASDVSGSAGETTAPDGELAAPRV